MASYWKILEISCYVVLLMLMIPVRIKEDHELDTFLDFVQNFNKSYENKKTFDIKFNSFKLSLENIRQLNINRTNSSAYYGFTKFSDYSSDDFISGLQLQYKPLRNVFRGKKYNWDKIPRRVDWREKGVITDIKNQENCGACWAFSVIETVESMAAIKYNKLVEFSIQQSVDCSTENMGCLGGDMCSLGHWLLKKNISVLPEIEYPYINSRQTCVDRKTSKGVYVSEYSCQNLVNNEDLMLTYLAFKGPLVVGLNVLTWQNYVGGIIQFHCDSGPDDLNHSAQIVGYDLTGDVPYYIVRNSWGLDYGDKGYVYIAIGKNICGIANRVMYLDVL